MLAPPALLSGLALASTVTCLPFPLHLTQFEQPNLLMKRAPNGKTVQAHTNANSMRATYAQDALSHAQTAGVQAVGGITAPLVVPAAAVVSAASNLIKGGQHALDGNYGYAAKIITRGVILKGPETIFDTGLALRYHGQQGISSARKAAQSALKAVAGDVNGDKYSLHSLQKVKNRPNAALETIFGDVHMLSQGNNVLSYNNKLPQKVKIPANYKQPKIWEYQLQVLPSGPILKRQKGAQGERFPIPLAVEYPSSNKEKHLQGASKKVSTELNKPEIDSLDVVHEGHRLSLNGMPTLEQQQQRHG